MPNRYTAVRAQKQSKNAAGFIRAAPSYQAEVSPPLSEISTYLF